MIGDALDQLHDEIRPAGVGRAGVEYLGDIGVVHQRERLPLGLEPGDHVAGVHPGLDDLESDLAADRRLLLGHEDDAHASFADALEQLVRPDAIAGPFDDRAGLQQGRRRSVRVGRVAPAGAISCPAATAMKLPASSNALSSCSTRWRSTALSPQACSRIRGPLDRVGLIQRLEKDRAFGHRGFSDEPGVASSSALPAHRSMRRPAPSHAKILRDERSTGRSFVLDRPAQPGAGVAPEAVGRAW